MKRVACTFCLMLSGFLTTFAFAEAREPLRRGDAFLGIHFDFHAGPDCKQVGVRTTPEMVDTIIDKVKPDYIQIDCKGHPGYSSYPTSVGNRVAGYVGDPLRVWRDVTRKRGVALFMHYSGVIDARAVQLHPEWAAHKEDGTLQPQDRTTSVFGPYVNRLMIPQLQELAQEYEVDGVWVDGDCWGAQLDYSDAAVEAWREATGTTTAPKSPDDPNWDAWRDFNREGYRRYLRHYVDALHDSYPDFQVISNWAFSGHMPEPVSAKVDGLSGDFKPDDSINSARFQGRCLEGQGAAWDLMSWSFSRNYRTQKPAAQLKQEAAAVLSLGGGYQAYFKQDRDGAVRDMAEMDVMAEVAAFCRARQEYCHHSKAIPQIALLYSKAGHYRTSSALFNPYSSKGVLVLQKVLKSLLEKQYAVEIVSEHHLEGGAMSTWPLIIVPGWDYLEPVFRDQLALYANSGGSLLLIGDATSLFEGELKNGDPNIVFVSEDVDEVLAGVRAIFAEPLVEVTGSTDVDVSPRRIDGKLGIHLVNTSGPHANNPKEGISEIDPIGPLQVTIRLASKPKAVVQQPEGKTMNMIWQDDRAVVTLPKLDIYSILVVEP